MDGEKKEKHDEFVALSGGDARNSRNDKALTAKEERGVCWHRVWCRRSKLVEERTSGKSRKAYEARKHPTLQVFAEMNRRKNETAKKGEFKTKKKLLSRRVTGLRGHWKERGAAAELERQEKKRLEEPEKPLTSCRGHSRRKAKSLPPEEPGGEVQQGR